MPIKNKKLSSTVLAALGLGATACGPCLNMVACLSMKADSDTGGDSGTGPCLTPVDDTDTYTGPCLDYAIDTDTGCDSADTGCGDTADTGDTGRAVRAGGSGGADGLAGALTKILERSVLPEDVARIRARRGKDADQE